MGGKLFTSKEIRWIEANWRLSHKEMALVLGRSVQSIESKICRMRDKRRDLKERRQHRQFMSRFGPDVLEQVRALFAQGYTDKGIARIVGIQVWDAKKLRHRLGLRRKD